MDSAKEGGEKATEESATLEGGSYEVIRRRLLEQAAELGQKADALNKRRKDVFGGSEFALIATERVRTENNCVPRDIVSIAGHLLFGYQVYIGLKAETQVSDVLSLHRFEPKDDGFDLSPVPLETAGGFLSDEAFTKEFKDLFRYIKEAKLLQLKRTDTRLLTIVQVGASARDVKVFRFAIDAGGRVGYMDARGEDDAILPRAHDFEWTLTTRDDHVPGPHPHVSILDEMFVETVGGDLTIKIENNTKDGRGIYREPVTEANQTLDDGEIAFAKLGGLIALRVKPFREEYRYFVFNTRTQKVQRVDAIGQACLELPEDHGIVFPGGYYLQSGETKVFDEKISELEFERVIRSPNGEDVLYVFHRRADGHYSLLPYNVIRKEVANPIQCHGYSLFDDGRMVVFRAASDEPTRVHPMQVWQTPFTTQEFAAKAPTDGSYLAKVGNADLVRGISDALSIARLCKTDAPTRRTYEDLIAETGRYRDAFFWLGHADVGDILSTATAVRQTAELVIDEFEKVTAIRKRAAEALEEAIVTQKNLLSGLRPEDMKAVDSFMTALTAIRKQRGHLITLKDLRAIDLARVDLLEKEAIQHFDVVSRACVDFLLKGDALRPLLERIAALLVKIEAVGKASDLQPFGAELDSVNEGLTLLAEVVSGLKIDDATARTRILEGISEVFAQLNRARATYEGRRKDLGTTEARAEFAVQFKLYGQAVTSSIALSDTPERCDQELSRLLVQLEELEGRFGEFDEFAPDLAKKREEVNDAVGAKRQTLADERQRRGQNLFAAADRILAGVARRAKGFTSPDELNAYFASDAMVLKVADLADQLTALGDTVKAEEAQARLKSARQDALRILRDKTDLYEEGDSVIKLGRHKFRVSTQPLELALVAREGGLALHLSGTDFYEAIEDASLVASRDLWSQELVSESGEVYRAEYLAAQILFDAEDGKAGRSIEALQRAHLEPGGLLETVRGFAADRYDEGYERGVHDADAALILEKLLAVRTTAGLLRYAPRPRALACLYWAHLDADAKAMTARRARSFGRLRVELADPAAQAALGSELAPRLATALREQSFVIDDAEAATAARYLVEELAAEHPRFVTSAAAIGLKDALLAHLEDVGARRSFDDDLRSFEKHLAERWDLAISWLTAFVHRDASLKQAAHFVPEAAAILVTDRRIDRESSAAVTAVDVPGVLGQHARVEGRALKLRLDEFLARLRSFAFERVPRYREYKKARSAVLEREKRRLRIDEFTPRVLTSFVRNRLIDEVYLPLIGTNMAKQLGALGAQKRTDLMGLLLLISPPGYGKTTLMEYVASRLGLVFMKVNGPSLGHEVKSLDPTEAPNATAKQEVEKVNLALEMGNNVMLYLDDIQHTNSEFLQKFISLCDAQRKIEGVWRGRTQTYDLRGKRFCVVMAGNPYTESGAKFQIPDMLANRADTYNLGDILDGKDDLFAVSYLENALTSNPTLAPLSGRDAGDVHKLLRIAKGEDVPTTDLSHGYSGAEIAEIVLVLKLLGKAQETLLAVNRLYIASASQEDAFRTEPPFKLQGSYRNMNKIAEKVVSAMNDEELQRLLDDHYTGESQTLTTGAEQNLLKLAELRGRMSEAQTARWREIKEGYQRVKRMGGKADDPVTRVTGTLSGLDEKLQGIRDVMGRAVDEASKRHQMDTTNGGKNLEPLLSRIESAIGILGRPKVEVSVQSPPGIPELVAQQIALVEHGLVPLVQSALMAQAAPQTGGVIEERLAEVTAALYALKDKLARSGGGGRASEPPPPRFEVLLEPAGRSNFYCESPGDDVVDMGGIFVATYAKLPAQGARVLLTLSFPGGGKTDVLSTVVFAREAGITEDPSKPPGFGARIAEASLEARGLIRQYASRRAPLIVPAGS